MSTTQTDAKCSNDYLHFMQSLLTNKKQQLRFASIEEISLHYQWVSNNQDEIIYAQKVATSSVKSISTYSMHSNTFKIFPEYDFRDTIIIADNAETESYNIAIPINVFNSINLQDIQHATQMPEYPILSPTILNDYAYSILSFERHNAIYQLQRKTRKSQLHHYARFPFACIKFKIKKEVCKSAFTIFINEAECNIFCLIGYPVTTAKYFLHILNFKMDIELFTLNQLLTNRYFKHNMPVIELNKRKKVTYYFVTFYIWKTLIKYILHNLNHIKKLYNKHNRQFVAAIQHFLNLKKYKYNIDLMFSFNIDIFGKINVCNTY